jgi:hypothetical protein
MIVLMKKVADPIKSEVIKTSISFMYNSIAIAAKKARYEYASCMHEPR